MENELQIMQLIANGGDARSHGMKSISLARKGQFEAAHQEIALGKKCVTAAHHIQTELIQKEASGEKIEIRLLMIHAQDHLMNAITVLDLATEFILIYQERERNE